MLLAAVGLGLVGAVSSTAPHDRGQAGPHWPTLALATIGALSASRRLPWLSKIGAGLLAGYMVWLPSSIYSGEAPDFLPYFAILPWLAGLLAIRASAASTLWWLLLATGFFLLYLSTALGQDPGVYFVGQRLLGATIARISAWLLLSAVVVTAVARLGAINAQTKFRPASAEATPGADSPDDRASMTS